MMVISGIYQISSVLNPEKIYIGSAVDTAKRWNRHINDLRKNKHANHHLQHHFNKYGEEDFIFSILFICDKSTLLYREQYYIDTCNPYFNICRNADSRFGVVVSFATRKKIAASWKHRSPISMESRLKKFNTEFQFKPPF